MANDSQDNEERSPSFTKALMGRILAVSIFVVLGTFAVVHSMMGPKDGDADQVANAELLKSGVNVETSSQAATSGTIASKNIGTKTPAKAPAIRNSFASKPFSQPASKPDQRFSNPATSQASSKSNTSRNTNNSAFGAKPSTPSAPAITVAKPATKKPPLRFAQLPGNTNPAAGTSGGFATRKPTDPIKSTFGNATRNATNQASNLKTSATDSASKLVGDARNKIQSKANDTANAIRGQFPGFGTDSRTTSRTSQTRTDSPPPLRGKSGSSFANRSPIAGNRPPTASFDTSRDLKPVQQNKPKERSTSQASSRPGNSPNFNRNTRPSQPATTRTRTPAQPSFASQRSPANTSRTTRSAIGSSAATSRSRVDVASRTSDTPGDRELDGVQAPALTVEKLSPREIQVNRESEFEIVVKNVGRVTAQDVRVFDEVPAGTDFIGSAPDAGRSGQKLEWSIGALRPGQEKRIKIQLKPTRPGEIGSIAHVTFATQASMRTRVTKPVLEIRHSAKPQVLIGDPVLLDVIVENKGDGPATNVIVQEDVPKQLEYADGYRELEYEIGTLMPGQSKRVQLGLKAAQIGRLRNIMFASATGGLKATHEIDMEVIAPKLVTSAEGPTRRFLQRKVGHRFNIENTGTAEATNVELVARLPSGLRYLSANNQGRYDANSHAVYWSLAQMQPSIKASVELETMPVEVGTQDIKFEAIADLNQKSESKQALSVEHLVDVFIDIDDVVDPIEIGSDTSYRIRIVNQGTKTATNVKLQIDFPNGLRPTSVDGNLRNQIQGQAVTFAPISSISPGDEISVVVSAQGTAAGDHRISLSMQADGRQTQVTKQETTRVYSDR